MLYVEAPNDNYTIENSINLHVFMAGGITNCPDWQTELYLELRKEEEKLKRKQAITLYNPRRKDFDISDPKATEIQISWEFNKLKEADIILVWFSNGSLNPIVLYELGMHVNSDTKRAVIGFHPEYERKKDVLIQTALARPELTVQEDWNSFVAAVKNELFYNLSK